MPVENAKRNIIRLALVSCGMMFSLPQASPLLAQYSYEEKPIDYNNAPVDDPIARLQKSLDNGEFNLDWDDKHGWLKSVLAHLDIADSSQGLVFSKTSFQLRMISPRTPRAVYFGDSAYVGWCQGGTVLELSAVDPKQGAIFYSLDQKKVAKPKFERLTYQCTQCHASSLTQGVPGHTVRSVYPAPDGRPILSAGTHRTNHESPLKERWGGWYVTGEHGDQVHMGNQLVRSFDNPDSLDLKRGSNVTDLRDFFYTAPYLKPHSDIVALMVLEHQTYMHNLLTRASYEGRTTERDAKVMNEMLERPLDFESESTQRRFQSSAYRMVKYMLFCDEAKLTSPVSGNSGFQDDFEKKGPFDELGRSLRQFDLQSRLFKYPCSYLIYSESFDQLPPRVKEEVYLRLWEILNEEVTDKETVEDFQHLSTKDRRAILEIISATKKDLPEYWQVDR